MNRPRHLRHPVIRVAEAVRAASTFAANDRPATQSKTATKPRECLRKNGRTGMLSNQGEGSRLDLTATPGPNWPPLPKRQPPLRDSRGLAATWPSPGRPPPFPDASARRKTTGKHTPLTTTSSFGQIPIADFLPSRAWPCLEAPATSTTAVDYGMVDYACHEKTRPVGQIERCAFWASWADLFAQRAPLRPPRPFVFSGFAVLFCSIYDRSLSPPGVHPH